MHQGQGPGLSLRNIGQPVGEETHTLGWNEMPIHVHDLIGSSNEPDAASPANRFPARAPIYGSVANELANGVIVQSTGGGGAHENMPPFTALNFIIATQGVFPSRP
jgi:microcystin-dependent protein